MWGDKAFGNKYKEASQNVTRAENVILSNFSESDIKLLGVIVDNNKRWALLSASTQNVAKVQQGDLVGKEMMQVEKITLSTVVLFSKRLGQKILKDKR